MIFTKVKRNSFELQLFNDTTLTQYKNTSKTIYREQKLIQSSFVIQRKQAALKRKDNLL